MANDEFEVEELYSAWSLFIVCILLLVSLLTSYYLQINRIRAVHETVVSIFAGMVVGLVVRLSPGDLIREMLTFKHTLFFNLLLPPIILNSGYELKQENFFRNFSSILTFAFIGTFISAVGIGVLVFIYSILGLEGFHPDLVECLIFGSTLSATDPVTILAIFQQYKVDPKLYSVIFGESILNDAVAIVLYETLSQFHGTKDILSIVQGTGIFLLSFSTSLALGVAFGLATSLLLKHSKLNLYPGIESCLVALVAYTSYFLSNGLSMSGIVSLLFCGITLKHYAYHTMSRRTQRTTKYLFSVLAQLSENFIFIYLGLNLFTQEIQVFKPLFIVVALTAVIATRYAAVFPLSSIINVVHRARGQQRDELPHSYQMMLFWAGLRGAVGVALASGFKGPNKDALRTTVLIVVVLTVIMFGGTTARMLEVMGIRTGVEDDAGDSSTDEEERAWLRSGRTGPAGARWLDEDGHGRYRDQDLRSDGIRTSARSAFVRGHQHRTSRVFSAASDEEYDSDGGEVLPMSRGMTSTELGPNATSPGGPRRAAGEAWFNAIDERYLLPLFSNAVASRSFHARRANRRAASAAGGEGNGSSTDEEGDDERDGARFGTPLTALSQTQRESQTKDFTSSIGQFLRGPAAAASPSNGNGSPVDQSSRSRSPQR